MIVVLAMDFEGNLWSSDDDVTSNGWCSRDEVSPVEGGEPGTNVISLDSSGFMVTVNVGISNAGICKMKNGRYVRNGDVWTIHISQKYYMKKSHSQRPFSAFGGITFQFRSKLWNPIFARIL